MKQPEPEIAVVIPCYRRLDHIDGALARIGPEVARIVVVDVMMVPKEPLHPRLRNAPVAPFDPGEDARTSRPGPEAPP